MIFSLRRTVILFGSFVFTLLCIRTLSNIPNIHHTIQSYSGLFSPENTDDRYYEDTILDAKRLRYDGDIYLKHERGGSDYNNKMDLDGDRHDVAEMRKNLEEPHISGRRNLEEPYISGRSDSQGETGMKPDGSEVINSEIKPGPFDVRLKPELSLAKTNVDQKYIEFLGCKKLPDVLTIGFEKCGTVTLNAYLSIHPTIFHPNDGNYKLFNKEGVTGAKSYTKTHRCTPPGKLRLNKMATRGMASKAYGFIPNAKLLAVVREPVERAMSHYLQRLESDSEVPGYTFDTMIASIMNTNTPFSLKESVLFRQSSYIERLEPWLEYYSLDNLHIIDGDNFVKHPAAELQKVEQFLRIEQYISEEHFVLNNETNFYCLNRSEYAECMPSKKGRAHPEMSNETRTRLQQYFKPLNERLFNAIGKRFNWNY